MTEESYDGNGQFIQREGHTYDSYDRLVETRYYDEDGSCTGWRVYTYSPWGDRIESFYYDTDEVQAGFVYEGFITKS